MRFVDEYRDPAAARALVARITDVAGDDHFKFMEVCGGHTHTIYRHGIEHVLPSTVELVHGPGCPVCVIPMGRVDDAIAVAETPGVIFTSFGDMMRVPGGNGNLLEAKARGADVRFVYSPLDALRIASETPDRDVVFFAVGFETTAPSTALTLLRARELGVTNFTVFCNHVTIVPPIKAILESPDLRLDGFLGPGHVSTVVGNRPYRFVTEQYGKPLVTAGFEPLDILQAIDMLLAQIREGRCEVENQYTRVVKDEGNPRALAALAEVFELRPHFEWRGLGFISQSALKLRPEFADFDAELRYSVPGVRVADPKACQCGEVLKGVIKPWECKVFGTACTPETPIGTCMVSSEGACAAYYNFGRLHREVAVSMGRVSG
jgi:hydrogenase expression/formation protein HypD